MTGLYDARLDHMPVLAIAGQQARTALGGHYQQEVDLVSLFKDVAGAFVQQATCRRRCAILSTARCASRIGERRVTAIVLPNDLQDEPYAEPAPQAWHGPLRRRLSRARIRVPRNVDLRRAAEVLNAGEKVAILVGAGALHATDEVIAVADKLRAGVAKALLGKAALPDDLPWVTGSIGLLGTKPSYELMTECDTLLMIGSGFPYSEFLPKEGQARGVQIDIAPGHAVAALSDGSQPRRRRAGDAARAAAAARPEVERRLARRRSKAMSKEWWKTLEERAMQPADPVNPQRVTWELSPRLPDGVIVTSDSGSCANWYARDLQDAPRHDGVAVRRPRLDGRGGALRDRREISPIRTGR